ncbi:MAG: hypothetical protein IKV03_06505 [Alphaproteobacteria bacterium]|nr:hypothetical protein [Alphaproteobacteria bacterium]
METTLVLFYSLIIIGFILFIVVIEKYKRIAVVEQERAHHLDDVLSSAPEGFYYEIKSKTKTQTLCSRRLCLMLNIVDTSSDFTTLLTTLSDKSAEELSHAWNNLLKTGDAFELTIQNSLNLMHFTVRGYALKTPYIDQHAHILWFENISKQTAEFSQNALKYSNLSNEKSILENALNSLPYPIIINKRTNEVVFENTPQKTMEDTSDLHWETISFKSDTNHGYKIKFGQDKTAEDKLNAHLLDAERAHKLTLKELPCAICIFDANTKLSFHNRSFADLWKLDNAWLKKEPLYDDLLNKMQEKGYLPQVKDFAQYKRIQKDSFARLTKPSEDFFYLENGRLVRRLMIPHAKGGILFIDEIKTIGK